MKNTNTVIAELQAGQSLSISHRKSVGSYSCVGESNKIRGQKNMSAFSVFKTFTEIEVFEFFSMVENRNRFTNEVDASYINEYSEYEIKRFRKAIKSLIEKDCVRVVSKKTKIYMINPQLILGAFDMYDSLVEKYNSLSL